MLTAIIALMLLLPIITFVVALSYGLQCGFNYLYPVVTFLIILPTVWLYYNNSAIVYIFSYMLISLAGSWLGGAFSKERGGLC